MNCHHKRSVILWPTQLMGGLLLLMSCSLNAAEVRVAVASNFHLTLEAVAGQFETNTGHTVTIIPGSTGKHFAQIINGAPYDLFLAADRARPLKLAVERELPESNIKTYALGRLLLWVPSATNSRQAETALFENHQHLALANPNVAPYGEAAQRVLKTLSIDRNAFGKIVMGENIAQTFQFVATGNAELGFIAESQLLASREIQRSDFWRIPEHLYPPIEQAAMLLNNSPASVEFFHFLSSNIALEIIQARGYATP